MEDIERNLDLLFREAFADATEEVSPAVWAGVSRGLAKASAPKVIFPVWLRWASLSLAAAAAVALGVFLFTRSGNSNLPIYNNDGQIVADVPAPVTVTETEEVAPLAEEQPSHSANLLAAREETSPRASLGRSDNDGASLGRSDNDGALGQSDSDVIPSEVEESAVTDEIPSPAEQVRNDNEAYPVTTSEVEESAVTEEIPSPAEQVRNDNEASTVTTSEASPVTTSEASPVIPSEAKESVPSAPVIFREEVTPSKKGVSLLAGANLGGNVGSRSAAPARMASSGSGAGVNAQGMYGLDEFKYGLPISATLGVKWQFHPRWAVGTGVSFTMLPSSCSGTYINAAGEDFYSDHINHFQTYIGVPLNFYFTIVESKAVGFYTFAGAAVERSIINRYTFRNGSERIRYNEPVKGVQPSVGLGIGVDFRFTKFLSLYIDPSARYYFDCKQPQSIRTVQPFSLSLDAGLRFGF